jgi:peptidoglycan hydrolase-like amidase
MSPRRRVRLAVVAAVPAALAQIAVLGVIAYDTLPRAPDEIAPDPPPAVGFAPPRAVDLAALPEEIRVLRTGRPYRAGRCAAGFRGRCVERLALEDYVEGVVLAEEGVFARARGLLAWRDRRAAGEAWALQALAARTYALYLVASGRHRGRPYDVEDTPGDQAYGDARHAGARRAAARTRAFVLVDAEGRLMRAEYSASCAGRGTWSLLEPRRPIPCHRRCQARAFPGSTHGRGMCQWGSLEFARDGATLPELIGRYFPGARLGRLGPAATPAPPP